MAKFSMISSLLSLRSLRLSRAYTVGAENAKVQTTMRKIGDSSASSSTKETAEKGNEVFWIRDPKTGYWLPENHLGDVDVAELRAKLLSNNTNFLS